MINHNPYHLEVEKALTLLQERGFTFTEVDDGGDEDLTTNDLQQVLKTILSVESSVLFLSKDDKNYFIEFVLGNEPGVAMSDFSSSSNDIECVSEEVYDFFNPDFVRVEEDYQGN